MSTIEELLGRKSSGSGLEKREYGRRDVTLTTWHPLPAKVGTNFADTRQLLGRYSSLADSGLGSFFGGGDSDVNDKEEPEPPSLHRASIMCSSTVATTP
jgi:hypothetical protein